MEQRIYHGTLTPRDVARELQAAFHHGNMRVQVVGDADSTAVQVATSAGQRSGGQTAITVQVRQIEDGVMIQIGEQSWLGIAASMGTTAVSVLFQPLRIIDRLDDIANLVRDGLQLPLDRYNDALKHIAECKARVPGIRTSTPGAEQARAAGEQLSSAPTAVAC